jgi:hypothetical protein
VLATANEDLVDLGIECRSRNNTPLRENTYLLDRSPACKLDFYPKTMLSLDDSEQIEDPYQLTPHEVKTLNKSKACSR